MPAWSKERLNKVFISPSEARKILILFGPKWDQKGNNFFIFFTKGIKTLFFMVIIRKNYDTRYARIQFQIHKCGKKWYLTTKESFWEIKEKSGIGAAAVMAILLSLFYGRAINGHDDLGNAETRLNCHLVTMITNDHFFFKRAAEIKNLLHFVKEEISCCWEIPMKNKSSSRGSLSLHFKWQSFSQEDKLRDKNSPHHHQKCRYSLSAVLRARATETGNGFLFSGTFLRRFYATFLNQFWLNLYQIEFKRCKIEIKSLLNCVPSLCVFQCFIHW